MMSVVGSFSASILAVANDYDGLIQGTLNGKKLNEQAALEFIDKSRGWTLVNDLGLLGQMVDDFSLALVTPLGSHDDN